MPSFQAMAALVLWLFICWLLKLPRLIRCITSGNYLPLHMYEQCMITLLDGAFQYLVENATLRWCLIKSQAKFSWFFFSFFLVGGHWVSKHATLLWDAPWPVVLAFNICDQSVILKILSKWLIVAFLLKLLYCIIFFFVPFKNYWYNYFWICFQASQPYLDCSSGSLTLIQEV